MSSTIIPLEEYLKTDAPATHNPTEFFEAKETLAKAIERLPQKERLVISLYYYEELTLKEIAAVMKLSEARISQLHTQAIFRLRGYLANSKSELTF